MDYEKARKSVLSQGQDLWIKIWEETTSTGKKRHLKAHRTKKEKEKLTQSERFVTEGNEKADELAKAGAMMERALRL